MGSSWFTDHQTPHDVHRHKLKRILVKAKTPFQNAVLADSFSFGRVLVLDGEIQSARLDEFIYHEALVQPAMTLHPRPRDVLILGGGEGATVREILRHRRLERVTMVDIDGKVVDFCKTYLKDWHQGALQHPKTHLVIGDAKKFITQTHEQFDIIISDLPTPEPGDAVAALYTQPFYQQIKSRLKPGGLLVVQSGSGNIIKIRFHADVKRKLESLFRVVRPYYAFVPSFDEPWAFLIASQKADPKTWSARAVDKKLGTLSRSLQFYDGEAHQGLFCVPKYIRKKLT